MHWKAKPKIKDPELLRKLHFEWGECVLCGKPVGLSLHHVHRHPRNDVRGNLVMLCGSGTTGCHGKIEHNDPDTLAELGRYIIEDRPDVVVYLEEHLGVTQAREWLRVRLAVT